MNTSYTRSLLRLPCLIVFAEWMISPQDGAEPDQQPVSATWLFRFETE